MTWTAAIMPDDALPPDSLVGRMLRPSVDDVTWETPTEFRAHGARVSGANGEPIADFVFDECRMKDGETYRLTYDAETGIVRPELLAEAEQFLEEYADDFKALAAIERAELPLWRVMAQAWSARVIINRPDGEAIAVAAEIEALRDWLVPDEAYCNENDKMTDYLLRNERQRIRDRLTEQARIARGDA